MHITGMETMTITLSMKDKLEIVKGGSNQSIGGRMSTTLHTEKNGGSIMKYVFTS